MKLDINPSAILSLSKIILHMKRALLIATAAFTFGLASAYISIQIFNNMHVDSDRPSDHWYDSFIFTLIPAGLISKELYGPAESLSTYEDCFDDRDVMPVMLLNGLGWMVIILIFSFLIPGVKMLFLNQILRRLTSHDRQTRP